MSKYIVKRVFLAVATLLIVCGITFFSMNAIPGGPFDGEKATSPAVELCWNRDSIWINRFRSSLCFI